MGSIMTAIYKMRHECLKDNETPRDVLIGADLKDALMHEADPMRYQFYGKADSVFGMNIEWKPRRFGISIRTMRGDLRMVEPRAYGDKCG